MSKEFPRENSLCYFCSYDVGVLCSQLLSEVTALTTLEISTFHTILMYF
jgi:hypothetical protein